MEIKDRIREIMEVERLSLKSFAECIGVQQSTLSHIMNGRNKPSLEVVMRIHQAYKDISLEWLLYGVGQMTNGLLDNRKEGGVSESRPGGLYTPSLFDEKMPVVQEEEEQLRSSSKQAHIPNQEIVKQEIRYIESPVKKITEIRIFFDDNTYEIFQSQK